ncbi:MAG: glycosyltransferase family 2 protein [candidate division Zixibacteria bacterium]|nr:glycosyltransferase family 2 protein [candidate division Zixibacteria bacterium]
MEKDLGRRPLISAGLTVIIVNWNVRELLIQCLDSIFSQANAESVEVIVVDNNSSDGSVGAVKSLYPNVKLIANRTNLGYGSAINQAARMASSDLLFVLNPDTIVLGNTLLVAKRFMEDNPKVGVGGCFIYHPDRSPQDCFFRFPTLASSFSKSFSLFRILPKTRYTLPFFNTISIDNGQIPESVSGSGMVIRKSVFEEVEGFDEDYFLYYEETDLCYRIRERGWKIAAIPGTRIIHMFQQSARKNYSVAIFQDVKSEFRFCKKCYPKNKLIILRLIQFSGTLFRIAYWFLNSLFKSDDFEAKAKLKGYLSLLLANYDYGRSLYRTKTQRIVRA